MTIAESSSTNVHTVSGKLLSSVMLQVVLPKVQYFK